MQQSLNLTGGARIGSSNATYPFATFKVNKHKLSLNVSMIGNFEFEPKDIISIVPYTSIPVIGQGIKINHRTPGYNPKIIFWTTKDPNLLLSLIRQTGFLDDVDEIVSDEDMLILNRQRQSEFPINRIVFMIILFLSWILFMQSVLFFPFKDGGFEIIQRAVTIFCSVIFVICLLTLISPEFQKLILSQDRKFNEIKKGVIFITIIIGFILLSFLLI